MADKYISITRAIAWVLWRADEVLDENLHSVESLTCWPDYPPADMERTGDNIFDFLNVLRAGKVHALGRLNGKGILVPIGQEQWLSLTLYPHHFPLGTVERDHPDTLGYESDKSTFWANVLVSLADTQTAFPARNSGPHTLRSKIQDAIKAILDEQKPEISHGYREKIVQETASRLSEKLATVRAYGKDIFDEYEKS